METVWDLTVGGKVGGLAGLGVHRCGQALELAAAVQLAEVPHCQAVVAGAADKEVVVPRGELHTKAQLSRASRHELHLLRHWIQAISVKKETFTIFNSTLTDLRIQAAVHTLWYASCGPCCSNMSSTLNRNDTTCTAGTCSGWPG